jgi:NAD(P)-dependent dehydrogenase (short-subunit alcohol dehydrogenase family)
MKLVLADIEQGPLETAGKKAAALGAEQMTQVCDVSSRESVKALADAAFDHFGAVHVLCNNAGVSLVGRMEELQHSEWEWVLGVNLWGVIHAIESFVPRMVEQDQGGHIVNTSSLAGFVGGSKRGPYAASKFAVVGLSESLHRDLREHGIGVSVLCPMGVRTGIWTSSRNQPDEIGHKVTDISPDLVDPDTWKQPEQISPLVVDAIENDRLYVFTHNELGAVLDKKFDRIRRDYPPAKKSAPAASQ